MLQESVPRSIYLQLLGQPEARSDDNSLRAVGCAKSRSFPVVESLRKLAKSESRNRAAGFFAG